MWAQYFSTLFHFALSVGMASVLAAMAWLYADAYKASKASKELVRVIGFLLLAVSFLLGGVEVQGVGWSISQVGTWVPLIAFGLRMAGYATILVGMLLEPLQPMPYAAGVMFGATELGWMDGRFLLPMFAALVGFMYWRRSTVGLEAHVRRPAYGFFALAIFELMQLGRMWYSTQQVNIWTWVAPFSALWWMGRVCLVLALLLLGSWVFGYLLKQFTIQIFLIFGAVFLSVFFVVTAGYTGMLLSELRQEAASEVKTSINVLMYAFDEQESRLLSEATMVADQPEMGAMIEDKSVPELTTVMTTAIKGKRISQVVVVDTSGKVMWRSDNPDRTGEIWSDTLTINRISRGEVTRTVMGNTAGGLSEISLMAAAPVKTGNKVVGGVILGLTVDPLLLSGIKTATGLEAAVFYKTTLVATSLSISNSVTSMGIEESRNWITDMVLKRAEIFQGPVEFLTVPYIAVFAPLKDADGGVVGMVFGGRPELSVMAAAARSLELTFYITVVLMILSLWPAWRVAKMIAKQVR